jgi:hypothetical protein
MSHAPAHPGALALQRLASGEPADASTREHLAGCAQCQARRDRFLEQQRAFEREIGFERFAAGVERAARERRARPARRPWVAWAGGGLALAASLAVLLVADRGQPAPEANRLKGGAAVEVVVAEAPSGAQRVTSELPSRLEPVGPSDRVRLGIVPGAWHFVLVLSVDDQGEVTPVYSSGPQSLALSGASPQFLPESLAFTGHGLERLVVVLSDRALEVDVAAFQLRRRFAEAHGDLTRLEPLDLPGEQFQRTFVKR